MTYLDTALAAYTADPANYDKECEAIRAALEIYQNNGMSRGEFYDVIAQIRDTEVPAQVPTHEVDTDG